MQVANTLAYYDTAIITAVKSFIVQAPGCKLEESKFYDCGAPVSQRYSERK
jgi:hypothetical protein